MLLRIAATLVSSMSPTFRCFCEHQCARAIMIVDLAARYPDDWIGQFADEDAAAQELKEIRRATQRLDSEYIQRA